MISSSAAQRPWFPVPARESNDIGHVWAIRPCVNYRDRSSTGALDRGVNDPDIKIAMRATPC